MELALVRIREEEFPPVLPGSATTAVAKKVERFFLSVADIFKTWVTRRQSAHTRRAYREDMMSFVRFLDLTWPDDGVSRGFGYGARIQC